MNAGITCSLVDLQQRMDMKGASWENEPNHFLFPQKLTAGTWKYRPWKRKYIFRPPSFLGSMLIFRGVYPFNSWNLFGGAKNWEKNLQDAEEVMEIFGMLLVEVPDFPGTERLEPLWLFTSFCP